MVCYAADDYFCPGKRSLLSLNRLKPNSPLMRSALDLKIPLVLILAKNRCDENYLDSMTPSPRCSLVSEIVLSTIWLGGCRRTSSVAPWLLMIVQIHRAFG